MSMNRPRWRRELQMEHRRVRGLFARAGDSAARPYFVVTHGCLPKEERVVYRNPDGPHPNDVMAYCYRNVPTAALMHDRPLLLGVASETWKVPVQWI